MFFSTLFSSLPGVISQGLIWGLMSIGVYITYKILDIADLSVDGSITTGGAVCAVMIVNGYNVWFALFVSLLAGMLAGLATGIFHVFFGIPAILAGILTQLALYSVNLKIMGKPNTSLPYNISESGVIISSQKLTGVPFYENTVLVIILFNIAVMAVLYWFFGTELGCGIRATGCNIKMSRAQGINTDLNKILGLVMSNGIVALAGALLTQYQNFADNNMGRGAIVIGLAAIIIGEALFGKILKGNFFLKLVQVALGGIIYFLVYQAVILAGLDADLLKMLSAIVVAIFLAIPHLKEKYFTKVTVKKGAK